MINKHNSQDKQSSTKKEDEIKGSYADIDKPVQDEEFRDIGLKQAGEDNTEEEIKGSDADSI